MHIKLTAFLHIKLTAFLLVLATLVFLPDSRGQEATPDGPSRLESFEKYVMGGMPKNVTQIRRRVRTLGKEGVAEFDCRRQGFVNAYTVISRNQHYRIQTDWPLIETLRVADLLDNFTEIFIKHLGVKRGDLLQCQVRLYYSPEEFRRVVASMGLGMGIGGWFRPDQVIIVGFWNPDPLYHHETTLIHEATHLINHLVMRKWNNPNIMPTWFNEGMAVFFESSYMPWARKLDLGRNAFSRLAHLKNTLNNPGLPDDRRWSNMNQLMNARGMIPGQAYGESWVIVHYLAYRYGDSQRRPFTELRNLWTAVCQGKVTGDYQSMVQFVKQRSSQTMEQFMADVTEYARELSLPETYLADGKTMVEWELVLPDAPDDKKTTDEEVADADKPADEKAEKDEAPKVAVAKPPAPEPWMIKIKNPEMADADQGDIALRTMSKLGAGELVVATHPELTDALQTFFGADLTERLSLLELDNRQGIINLDDEFLQFEVAEDAIPSEARLKIADIKDFEVTFRLAVDKGASGLRIWGDRSNPDSGYLLGFGEGTVMLVDLAKRAEAMAAASDATARAQASKRFRQTKAVPFKLGQTHDITIRIEDKRAIVSSGGTVLAKMGGMEIQPGVIAFQVAAGSKARIADIKAKKL